MLQLRGHSWVTGLGKLNGTGLEICMQGRGKQTLQGLASTITLLGRIHGIYSGYSNMHGRATKTQINYEKCRLQKESPVSSDTSFFPHAAFFSSFPVSPPSVACLSVPWFVVSHLSVFMSVSVKHRSRSSYSRSRDQMLNRSTF